MNFSNFLGTVVGKTPSETKNNVLQAYSTMTSEKFFDNKKNRQNQERLRRKASDREEMVCRLLASGMSFEEISVILYSAS